MTVPPHTAASQPTSLLSTYAGSPRAFRRHSHLPEALLLVNAPPDQCDALRSSLGRMSRVMPVTSIADCARQLLLTPSAIVVLTVPPATNAPVLEAYARLREQYHQTPFIALFISGVSDVTALAMLAAGDVRHVLHSERVHQQEHCHVTLAASAAWSTASRVWKQAAVDADDFVETLMMIALRLASRPVTLPELALAARMHERSLRKYCARHGHPSPQWFIGWARCLLATFYLEERGRSVQSVSELLHWNSAVILANHLKR